MAPIIPQMPRVMTMASHQGSPGPLTQLALEPVQCTTGWTRSQTTTAASPMTRPTERSISPSSRTKISAIARTM